MLQASSGCVLFKRLHREIDAVPSPALLWCMLSYPCCCVTQAISHMDFSSNGRQLALGFKDASVAMIAHMPWKGGGHRWEMVGSLMPHPGPTSLAGLAYGEAPSGVTKLFSLGNLFVHLLGYRSNLELKIAVSYDHSLP